MDPTQKIAPTKAAQSRLAERLASTPHKLGPQELPLCSVHVDDTQARAWRITLARVDRNDSAAFNRTGDAGNSSLLFPSQVYQYSAGQQNTPQVPARRANQVLGDAGGDVEPLFVEISWGLSTAAPHRMLANWPAQGGSIVVHGSNVDVWGGMMVNAEPPGQSPGGWPTFEATITPDESGCLPVDELSLTQEVFLEARTATVEAFRSIGPFGAPGGWSINETLGVPDPPPPTHALTEQVSLSSTAWTTTLHATAGQPDHGNGITVSLYADVALGVVTELRDNQWYNPLSGAWVAAPGNVGVVINLTDTPGLTVADLEQMFNGPPLHGGPSALVTVQPPDGPHAADTFLNDAENLVTVLADAACGTQGGAVYVPEFARRVRVSLAKQDTGMCGNEFRVPTTGQPRAILNWYDDRGNVVFTEFQGNDGVSLTEPNVWHEVPARAVMLSVYPADATAYVGYFHWRIAP